jgi:hypothetical protein
MIVDIKANIRGKYYTGNKQGIYKSCQLKIPDEQISYMQSGNDDNHNRCKSCINGHDTKENEKQKIVFSGAFYIKQVIVEKTRNQKHCHRIRHDCGGIS